jgi:tetratricopeptide (TPR) repeat protein
MSAETPSEIRRKAIAELIESIDAAENPERELLKHLVERVRVKNAQLAEAVYYCAIPRRFNAEVLHVLRQALEDGPTGAEEDERLLAGLLGFGFVRNRSDGGYTYDDSTRSVFLEHWREESRREQFQLLNQRLATFYEERHKQAQHHEQALERVRRVVYRANPARYVQLVSLVEKYLVGALLEALYHETLRSSETGYDFFVRYFHQYELIGRLAICESLLSAARDYLEAAPPETGKDSALRWLSYYQARLERKSRRENEAEEIFRKLLLESEDDVRLKLWVLGALGSLLLDQSKLREANELFEKELALQNETTVDLYNLPVSYSRVAGLHWTLCDLDRAAANYREAVRVSRDSVSLRRDMEVYSLLDLSGVLCDADKWTEAFDTALEALNIARTELPQDRAIAQAVVARLMHLLSRYDPRLLETLFGELLALTGEPADPFQKLSLDRTYANLLGASGQFSKADECIIDLRRRAEQFRDTAVFSDILFSEALLREDQGRPEDAIDLYDEIVVRSRDGRQGTAWHYAAAISNRALKQSELGRFQEAEAGLAEAIAKWNEIGNDKIAAYVQVSFADLLRRRGEFEKAHAVLDEAHGVLSATLAEYKAEEHRTRGETYRDQARWSAAREEYREALSINRSLNQLWKAAQNLAQLASIASNQGEWREAAEFTSEAGALWRTLELRERERPSPAAREADDLNAAGVQRFSQAGENRKDRVEQARQMFRSAIERVPDNFLYRVNLAYACAELQEWEEAAQSLEAALDGGPEWLRVPLFCERIVAYRRNLGAALSTAARVDEAGQAFAESQRWLVQVEASGRVPAVRLAALWLELGDDFLRLGYLDTAQTSYHAALDRSVKAENRVSQAMSHARLGFLACRKNELAQTLENFRTSVARGKQGAGSDATLAVRDTIKDLYETISSPQQFHVLSLALRLLASDQCVEPAEQRLLSAAGLALYRNKYRRVAYGLDGKDIEPLASKQPLRVELGSSLLIIRDFKTAEESVDLMIRNYLPAMRERIQKSMGITIPGVLFRGNLTIEPTSYLLMLKDIRIATGSVEPHAKFCPDLEACRRIGFDDRVATGPDRAGHGMWLAEPSWKAAEEAQLVLWDAYEYIIFDFEYTLRRRLADLLGFRELKITLAQWMSENASERESIITAALPNDGTWVRLLKVCRGLLDEQVPIRNFATILKSFGDGTDAEVIDIVESVRKNLRAQLPGNDGTRQAIGLPADFEDSLQRWVWQRNGKRFLAIPPGQVPKFLKTIQEAVGDRSPIAVALVVREPKLRPFVFRLIKNEFGSLPVLAVSELAEGAVESGNQIASSEPLATIEH